MKRSRINPVSAKRRAANLERVETRKVVAARSGGRCEGPPLIVTVDPVAASKCLGHATDLHEVLTRARGGSITDPANCLHLCRPCHSWVTDHPKESLAAGLVRSSWDR